MDFLCTLKKEGPGYNLELSFDNIKSALDAALEILAFADADCYLAPPPKEGPKTTPQIPYERYMEFPDKIRTYRKSHGYSQATMAKLLGVTQTTISYWEAGNRPSLKTEIMIREKLRKGEFAND